MSVKKLGILDCNVSNITSVSNAFRFLGIDFHILKSHEPLPELTHLILPGVGSFPAGMKVLVDSGADKRVQEFVKAGGALLGICLGMQFLGQESEEHGIATGLGLIKGVVRRLQVNDQKLPIPHVGWNSLINLSSSKLLAGIDEGESFYFVHSFAYSNTPAAQVAATARYGNDFPAVVQHERVYGVQFHPEKSQSAGLRILRNFFELC